MSYVCGNVGHRHFRHFSYAIGHEPAGAPRTISTRGTHTADGSSRGALASLTVEQPVRARSRVSANIRRAAFALPAAERERTPLVTPRPLARREGRGVFTRAAMGCRGSCPGYPLTERPKAEESLCNSRIMS